MFVSDYHVKARISCEGIWRGVNPRFQVLSFSARSRASHNLRLPFLARKITEVKSVSRDRFVIDSRVSHIDYRTCLHLHFCHKLSFLPSDITLKSLPDTRQFTIEITNLRSTPIVCDHLPINGSCIDAVRAYVRLHCIIKQRKIPIY